MAVLCTHFRMSQMGGVVQSSRGVMRAWCYPVNMQTRFFHSMNMIQVHHKLFIQKIYQGYSILKLLITQITLTYIVLVGYCSQSALVFLYPWRFIRGQSWPELVCMPWALFHTMTRRPPCGRQPKTQIMGMMTTHLIWAGVLHCQSIAPLSPWIWCKRKLRVSQCAKILQALIRVHDHTLNGHHLQCAQAWPCDSA